MRLSWQAVYLGETFDCGDFCVLCVFQIKETPLHIAARIKDGERCAEMLIKSGADVNATQEVINIV